MNRETIIQAIMAAKAQLRVDRLTFAAFNKTTGISMRNVKQYFDSWSDACSAAQVECGLTVENLVPNKGVSQDSCIAEIRLVADKLGRNYITQSEFKTHSSLHPCTPIRKFGSWEKALAAAGLHLSPAVQKEISLDALADDFM